MTYNPAMASVKDQRSEEALERALDELRNSEKKLRQVIDTIPTLAWSILPNGSNEFLNKRWHEYTGLSAEESHGSGWQVAIHPEDRAPLLEKWQGLLTSGEPGEMEARLRRHDGVFRWFLIGLNPYETTLARFSGGMEHALISRRSSKQKRNSEKMNASSGVSPT